MAYAGLGGKVAIVTGAASGIGAATCRRLVNEGCKVGAVDINQSGLEALAKSLGEQIFTIQADVRSEPDTQRYVDEIVQHFGDVTLFVNNAAILGTRVPMTELSLDDFLAVHRVNLVGTFLGMRTILRRMIAQGTGGAIVNIASVGALRAQPLSTAYGSTKRAIIGLSNTAAAENGKHRIRVNSVCPGAIETPMLGPAMGVQDEAAKRFAQLPLGRIGKDDEAAALIAYLLSDDATYLTAGVYAVDGGMSG